MSFRDVPDGHDADCAKGAALSAAIPSRGDRRRQRIGILGGSFNPAHAGHLHIARQLQRRLQLDQIWLMVSPGNPLKHANGMAPFADRLASARHIADGRRIIATDIEARLGTRYTVDTLRALRRIFPAARFVWLMGADNLEGFPRWRGWRKIAAMMPFAVHPRPTYNLRALAGVAAHHLHAARRGVQRAPVLADQRGPAWIFLPAAQHAASATALRAAGHFAVTAPAHADKGD